jgi:hypothetical protein
MYRARETESEMMERRFIARLTRKFRRRWWIGKPCRRATGATEFPGHKVRASYVAAKGLIFIAPGTQGAASKENAASGAAFVDLRGSGRQINRWTEIGVTP